MADKANFSTNRASHSEGDDSGDALAERYISFKTKTYCNFCLVVQDSLNK